MTTLKTTDRVAIQRDNAGGPVRIVFAHGAGAGLQSDFMQYIALGLAMADFEVVRFNFPYWQRFMDTGTRRPPNRQPQLQHAMLSVCAEFADDKPLVLMGKSMGARVAFQCTERANALAAIGLGFPLHPPGKKENLRVADLGNGCARNLVIQGDRDPFGKPELWRRLFETEQLPKNLELAWLAHGDHSFIPTKRSGLDSASQWQRVINHIQTFIKELT